MAARRFVFAGVFAALAGLSMGTASAQTLTQAMALAYDHNPDLAAALLNARSALEDITIREAGLQPTIGASLSGTYNWSYANGTFGDSSSLNAGLSYNQTLFDNNQTAAQIEQARAAAEAAEYAIRNTEQNVLLSVVQAYMSVMRDTQLVTLRQENVRFFEAQLQSARDRLAVGAGTRIDVAQAEARLAQAQAGHRAALNSLQTSQATFERYIGRRPSGLAASHNHSRLIPASIDAAIAYAEANHPAILSAKAGIRAAQAGAAAAAAAFGPSLTLNGSVGTGVNLTGMQTGAQPLSGQVRLNLSVPIYSGGSMEASVRKANLAQIRTEVDAMSAYDQIREAVISAWGGVQSADAQIVSARAAVAAGEQVLEGVVQERDLGARTTLDVLNSRAEVTSARESLIGAEVNKVIATFSLLAAMGRLTALDLGLPVEIKSATSYAGSGEDIWQNLRETR